MSDGPHPLPTGYAFEGKQVVPIVLPDVQADEQGGLVDLNLADVFDLLLFAADSKGEIADRAIVIGYLIRAEYAPRTLAELGARLGISKQAASKRLTAFRRKAREILHCRLTPPPLVE